MAQITLLKQRNKSTGWMRIMNRGNVSSQESIDAKKHTNVSNNEKMKAQHEK